MAWRKVKDFSEMYPRSPDRIVPKVREYIGRQDIARTYLTEATKLRTEKESEWDRTVFDEVVGAGKPAFEHEVDKKNGLALQKARELAEKYLKTRHDRFSDPSSPEYKRLESFWSDLESWVRWVKAIEKQDLYQFWIEIKSVQIPQGALKQ